MILWRYDSEKYEVGEIIPWRGDHMETIDENNKSTELALRSYGKRYEEIRINSIYTWRDEPVARHMWDVRLYGEQQKHHDEQEQYWFYKLEVNEEDCLHFGDLQFYTDTRTALETNQDPRPHIIAYWDQSVSAERPQIEVLITKGKVLKCEEPYISDFGRPKFEAYDPMDPDLSEFEGE